MPNSLKASSLKGYKIYKWIDIIRSSLKSLNLDFLHLKITYYILDLVLLPCWSGEVHSSVVLLAIEGETVCAFTGNLLKGLLHSSAHVRLSNCQSY